MPLVFVYGTLMRAGANHSVLARLGGTFAGYATTREPWTLVDLGPYPALVRARDGAPAATTRVTGEVWTIDDRALRELDAFEGCPELYTRERIAVLVESTSDDERTGDDARRGGAPARRDLTPRDVRAFVYLLAGRPPASARVIASGRYTAAGTPLPDGAAPAALTRSTKRRPRRRRP
ncbi:MAG: gamma-glutamylcyclotransferase [Labilithrix sp.]|nr:gamma-glutamylcyclotransferase [Labilithrix sp.]